jgi:hypothetical protein
MKTYLMKQIFLGVALLLTGGLSAETIIVKSGDNIASKLMVAQEGDVVRIEKGVYKVDSVITTTKNITVLGIPFENSNNDTSKIDDVMLKLNKSIKDNWIVMAGITVRGIKLIDGDHQIQLGGECNISYCNFENGIDQVSFDRSGYGEVSYCTFYKSGDDGIDIDSKASAKGAYINVHHNYFNQTDQDGIEFRTHARSGGAIMVYHFYKNNFNQCGIGVDGGDAIQIIDQDKEENSREILVYKNIINGNNVTSNGISCNDNKNSNAAHNPQGAKWMKEKIWIFNNTIANVKNGGIAGSNNTWVFNNVILNTTKGLVHCNVNNNLTYALKINTEDVVEQGINHYNTNPELNNNTLELNTDSYCIGKGVAVYESGGRTIVVGENDNSSSLGAKF